MSHSHKKENNIKIAVFLNIVFTIIEVIGGLWTNSLAILSDALHDFGDSIALFTSWLAEKQAQKQATPKYTYGYKRLSLLAALFSGLVLTIGSFFIFTRAIPRFFHPEHTNAQGMMGLAIVGILINGIGLWHLKQGQTQNEKVLSWHLLEDVLGWVVIFVGGAIVYFWDNHLIDPLMTLGFSGFILWGVINNLKETFNLFMQGVPVNINLDSLTQALLKVKGVKQIHDIHVWSLDGETNIFSGHIVVKDNKLLTSQNFKKTLRTILQQNNIQHSTLELENETSCSGIKCQSSQVFD